MDLTERIQRRRSGRTKDAVVVDWDPLNPACHLPNPVGRASVVEAILDALDPVFEDELPPDLYLWGDVGTGKSAIVTALMGALDSEFTNQRILYTATRGNSAMSGPRFVYVDGRRANTRFKLYHQVLDTIRSEKVPQRGIGTDDLLDEIREELQDCDGVVLAVDHVSLSGSMGLGDLNAFLDPFGRASLIAVGRKAPGAFTTGIPRQTIQVPACTNEVVDILTVRATRGLSRTLAQSLLRRIADWADGNAHDALAALYLAALGAHEEGASRIAQDHVEAAMDVVLRDGTTLSHLLALSETERTVLDAVIRISNEERLEIDTMADRIADGSHLTATTVKRLLYELAQDGVLERRQLQIGTGVVGRQPSQVEPDFAERLFEHVCFE